MQLTTLTVDCGGSGIKGSVLDAAGTMRAPVVRIPTPYPLSPDTLVEVVAELSTRQVAESVDATGMDENKDAARTGGRIARKARQDLERTTGRKVVSADNLLPPARKTLK